MLLHNEKIRHVIDTITSKVVLILGRFTPERKAILDAIRGELRKRDYLPVLFDFDRPTDRDFTETVTTLAGLSKFIVVDISEPQSIPLEIQATAPKFMIPFVPIIKTEERPFSMLSDIRCKYDWVLETISYRDENELITHFKEGILERAEAKSKELRIRKLKLIHTPISIGDIG